MAAENEEFDEEEKEMDFEDKIKIITDLSVLMKELRNHETNYESPINLNIANMREIQLSELEWHHYEVPPKKVKLTNSGHTAILSAKWFQERPFLTGGPLIGNYVFSQLHFHWGSNDMEGSEHTVDGVQYPVEMHSVHFKSAYLTQETALYEKDGVVVLVYFFKLQSEDNPVLQTLLDYFNDIQNAFTSIKLDVIPISHFLRVFSNDYFIYWGNITTSARSHLILWIICREPIGISAEQVDIFRGLHDETEEALLRNFRSIETVSKTVYHVNPSEAKYSTLLPIPRDVLAARMKQQKRHSNTK